MSKAFTKGIHEVEPIWQVGILWAVLAESADTGGAFSFLWELCPKNSGATPHYHDQHEGFFVVDGSITYLAAGEKLVAGAGSFVWIPKAVVHSFRVDTEQATLLNFYTPGGFEQAILQMGAKAKSFSIPPKDFREPQDREKMMRIFKEIGMHPVNEPDVLRL